MPHFASLRMLSPKIIAGSVLLAALPSLSDAAQSYRWIGPEEGGYWGDAVNWFAYTGTPEQTDFGFPVERAVASLENTAVDRNIIFNGATYDNGDGTTRSFNWVRTVTMTQTSAAVNQLSIMASFFRFGNDFTLEATGGGTSKLFLSNAEVVASGSPSILASVDFGNANDPLRTLWVKSGGVLEMAGTATSTNSAVRVGRGNVDVSDGGQILLKDGLRGGTDNSVNYAFAGDVSLDNGSIVFGGAQSNNPNDFARIEDVRMSIAGNFTAKDSQIINSDTAANRQIWLSGETNVISGNSTLDERITFVMHRSGDQSLTSSIGINSLNLRGAASAVTKLNIAAIEGGNIGQIVMAAGSDRAKTVQMESNLTTRAGISNGVSAGNWDGTSGVVGYTIDTNGYTYDMSNVLGRWTPNRANANITQANWLISGGGTVVARGVNFSSGNVAVSLGENTRLVIKGGADNSMNRLDSPGGGEIHTTSIIEFDLGAGNSAEIASNRQIGKLVLTSGTLHQSAYGDGASWNFYASGGVEINAGAHLQMNGDRVIYTQNMTFHVQSADNYGTMAANVSYYLSNMNLLFSFDTVAMAGTYDFFGGTHLVGTANSVVIGGIYNFALSYDGLTNQWTGGDGDLLFSFSQAEGLLTVVPEPGTVALLLAASALGLVAIRRRRNCRV